MYLHIYACADLRQPICVFCIPIQLNSREKEREKERVNQPADEKVRVKALLSQKKEEKKLQLPCSLFEVIQEEGGKRHTFSIALRHGVRQLPSCCTLQITLWFEVEF